MSKIYFENDYIVVIPTFKSVSIHKHNFLHIFLLSPKEGSKNCYRALIVDKNVRHQMPPREQCPLFLLIDPTSFLAEKLKADYLQGAESVLTDNFMLTYALSADDPQHEVASFVESLFREMKLPRREYSEEVGTNARDERVAKLIVDIKNYRYLESLLEEIARENFLSIGRLSHIFKEQTGSSLKGYLNIKQLEKAYKLVLEGHTIVYAALEAGFSSAAHLAAMCKKQTGISITAVLK